MDYEPVIGLEVHAEMQTRTKMFCACPVVDTTQAPPNTAVCPVCAGLPGTLPVVNRMAVEYALRVALALECAVQPSSIFARKNYFYPDLPKGYQISQYEQPLALDGRLKVRTSSGERFIRIRRVHLEEDTGKLTHVEKDGEACSLVDLNRAGVALLEIVSEPDLHTLEEVRAYCANLRAVLRALGVNSGDMEKGVIRFEANVSVRPRGSQALGTRVEIKNLNSFRAVERAAAYEIERQSALLESGGAVVQETLGWDEASGATYTQRSKEEAHDYRYFPEPDLPPLVVDGAWVERLRAAQPELPLARQERFERQYGLSEAETRPLAEEKPLADYFEQAVQAAQGRLAARVPAIWILGELFAWMNARAVGIEGVKVTPAQLVDLLLLLDAGRINLHTAKAVLGRMLETGLEAAEIVQSQNLEQISDQRFILTLIDAVLAESPAEVQAYLGGKETLSNWFFGQVMRRAGGKANPQTVRQELARRLQQLG